jgi:hypothetical protein
VVSKADFIAAHKDVEAKLNEHAVVLGRIEQKVDDLGYHEVKTSDSGPFRTQHKGDIYDQFAR